MKKVRWHTGVGPAYVITIFLLTIVAIFISKMELLLIGIIPIMKIPLFIFGVILIILGIILWVNGAIISRINKNVEENKLVTTGVYAWVRNPIYSAFTAVFTGILCFQNNLLILIFPFIYWFILIFPFIYWFILSIIVRKEEIFLEEKFGEEYLIYKSKVNRCIPWFAK